MPKKKQKITRVPGPVPIEVKASKRKIDFDKIREVGNKQFEKTKFRGVIARGPRRTIKKGMMIRLDSDMDEDIPSFEEVSKQLKAMQPEPLPGGPASTKRTRLQSKVVPISVKGKGRKDSFEEVRKITADQRKRSRKFGRGLISRGAQTYRDYDYPTSGFMPVGMEP